MELSRGRRACNWLIPKSVKCGQGRSRTADTRIFSPLLYRLSYLAKLVERGILLKSFGESRFRLLTGEIFYLPLDEIDHFAFELHVIERVDLLNAGRAGHVHLGEKAADHIQTDEV